MSYTRQDVIDSMVMGNLDHHRKDVLDCIKFLSSIKKTFTMDEIHDLLRKYGKNGKGRTGNYHTIIRALCEMDLLIIVDAYEYKLSSFAQYWK